MPAAITHRNGLGRNLSPLEVDGNFDNLVAEDAAIRALAVAKQDPLIAGSNITIGVDGRTISAAGTGGATPIINDLTTGGTSSALSAQQGVVLKTTADALATTVAGKQATLTAPGDVPGLTSALAGKQPTLVGTSDVPGLTAALGGKAPNILTGLSGASSADVVATDDSVTAFGKLQAKFTAIATTIRGTVLAGLSVATSSDVTSSDSILVAIGKLQAKFTAGIATTFASLTDKVTADLPGTNTPLATALAARATLGANVEAVTGTTYTFVAADKGKHKVFTNASGCTATVPSGLGADFQCSGAKSSAAGVLTFAQSGTTLNNEAGSLVLAAPNAGFYVCQTNTVDTFNLLGAFGAGYYAEVSVASAATVDLGALSSVNGLITGTVGIASFGSTAPAGTPRVVRFAGVLLLTHNATSQILPSAANITTAAGDRAGLRPLGSGNWVMDWYTRADGTALVGSSSLALTPDADVTTTTYTVVAGDLGKVKRFTNASGCAVSFNTGLGSGFNVICERSAAAGALTFGGTATLRASNGLGSLVGSVGLSYGVVMDTTDTYIISGDLGPMLASIGLEQSFTKGQAITEVTLTDAATVAVDASLSNNFYLVIGGNRTLGLPTNPKSGQSIRIVVKQDATGSRTLAYNAAFKHEGGVAPVLSTAANAVDVLSYTYNSTGSIWIGGLAVKGAA